MKETQLELFHKKTHQDMINAAYKAAEKLGIAPWVLIRAPDGAISPKTVVLCIKGTTLRISKPLPMEQKGALMGVFGMMSGWEKIKKVK